MRKLLVIVAVLSVGTLGSCFKEDQKIPPHSMGNISVDTIAMMQDYRNQVYFSIATGTAVSTNLKTKSDLAFECTPSGWHVLLNTSDFMYASDLGDVPFGQPYDTTGLKWAFDKSDGNPDSTAIGTWFTVQGSDTVSNGHVYAINAGLDAAGNSLGYYQVTFDRLRNGWYHFRYATLGGQSPVSDSVKKDTTVNYMHYSLTFQQTEPLEPPKGSWDLLFTQYTTMLYTDLGEPYPYLVTGVLSNRVGVEVAMDSIHDYNSVTSTVAAQLPLSKALDAIGYDWKHYDFDAGSYTVEFNRTYVIRTAGGFIYKLRFAGFYNSLGEKGFPVIEFQEL
jgi:hypothetical protein